MWCFTVMSEDVDRIRIFKTKEDLMDYIHLYENFINEHSEEELPMGQSHKEYKALEDSDVYIWQTDIEENGVIAFNEEKEHLLNVIKYNKKICKMLKI